MEEPQGYDTISNLGGAMRVSISGDLPAGVCELLLLRDIDWGKEGGLADPDEKQQEETESGEVIICRQCSHPLTEKRNAISVDDSHSHTFFNPAGYVYEIGCFNSAPGCWIHGPASVEFAWFAGFSWRLALCDNCTTHLGWSFASDVSTFYGLILKKISSTSL